MDEDYFSQTEMSDFRWQRKWRISHFARARYYGWDGSFNLLVIPQKIVFFYYMIDFLRLFQKRDFVLSSEHENQNVAILGTLLDQFMLRQP